MLDPTKKRYPTSKDKAKAPVRWYGWQNHVQNQTPYPPEKLRGFKQTLVCIRIQRPHRDWTRTVSECLLQRYGSAVACRRGKGSGCRRPGYGISPLGGSRHWPHHRITRTYIGLGKQTLGGHKQNLVCTNQDPGEKNSDPTRDWPRLECPLCVHECPGVSGGGISQQWHVAGSGALSSAVPAWYLHYVHHSLALGQTTGREHSPTHQEKLD